MREQWVRTSDRLPDERVPVLGHVAPKHCPTMEESDGQPDVFVRCGDRWFNCNSNNYLSELATVIYWMPVPPPPIDEPPIPQTDLSA